MVRSQEYIGNIMNETYEAKKRQMELSLHSYKMMSLYESIPISDPYERKNQELGISDNEIYELI